MYKLCTISVRSHVQLNVSLQKDPYPIYFVPAACLYFRVLLQEEKAPVERVGRRLRARQKQVDDQAEHVTRWIKNKKAGMDLGVYDIL